MKFFVLTYIVLCCLSFSIAQEVIIKASDSNKKAALFSLSGEKSTFIDSISAGNVTYQFNLANNHSGFYLIVFNSKKSLEFVFDQNDIELEVDSNSRPIVHKSDENKIYYEFVRLSKDYKTKTDLLFLILASYPDNDDYLNITKETLLKLQEEYLYFINVTSQSKPESFIARYVKSAQLPVIDEETPSAQHLNFLKSHSLDKINFNDDDLIYSDLFTNKAIEYLSYYRNPQLPMALLEKEFESAIDSLLSKAKVKEIVYRHIVEYLLDGFKKFGFDNVISYIIENYVVKDEICLDEKLETALERRIQQSKKFKAGSIVPNILLPDSSGSFVDLSKIRSDKTLIIFYASWCPHCKTLLPDIFRLYKNQNDKEFELLAISIDTSRIDWLNFIKTNNLNWTNVSDLKGWNGKAAIDYYIYATPTMFLIDKEKKLIKIITDIEELKNFL